MADQTCNPSVITQALGITATGPRTVIVPADPIIWDEGTSYEYLTLVASKDFGQGYVAKKDVPAGTPLTNTEYWVPVASFNAQLAAIQTQLANKADTSALTEVQTALNDEIERSTTADGTINETMAALTKNTSSVTFLNKKVVFFGDSTMVENGGTSVPTYVQNMTGATVTNNAVGGYNTANILSQLTGTSAIDADYVVVSAGVNDLQGNMNILPYDAGTNTTFNNVCGIIERIQALAPAAQVVWVCHAYYHNNAWGSAQTNSFGLTLHEYNDVIEYACSLYNVGCVRLDEIMGINESNYASQFIQSGSTGIYVHFNETNAERVARLMVLSGFKSFGHTDWSDGENLISDLYLAEVTTIPTSNIPSFTYPVGVRVQSGSPLTLHFNGRTFGTYYVSGYCFGAMTISYNGTTLATTSLSGYFCVPFKYVNGVNSITIACNTGSSNMYLIDLAVTRTRNNPALSPCTPPSYAMAFTSAYGNLNAMCEGNQISMYGNLKPDSPITITPRTTIVTVNKWPNLNGVGTAVVIAGSVDTQIPVRIAPGGLLRSDQLPSGNIENVTEIYVQLTAGKHLN